MSEVYAFQSVCTGCRCPEPSGLGAEAMRSHQPSSLLFDGAVLFSSMLKAFATVGLMLSLAYTSVMNSLSLLMLGHCWLYHLK